MSKYFLLITLIFFAPNYVLAANDSHGIATAVNLSHDAVSARNQQLIVILEFSSDHCPYCRLLENEFLKPMSLNQDYMAQIIIRSVSLEDSRPLIGFKGQETTVTELAAQYEVSVTPTMVFVDSNGTQLAQKLVGIWSIDYYGAYIDKRIESARQALFSRF